MEIISLNTSFLKVRGKHSSFVVDPDTLKSKAKVAADAILLLKNLNDSKFPNIENYRVLIKRPGEYEVNGMLITGRQADKGIVYKIIIDNIVLALGKASEIAKVLDKIDACQVLVLNVDGEIAQKTISSLEPTTLVLYGEKANEAAKSLGKDIKPLEKFALAKEKAAGEIETVVLG